jgi:hypothetical protein
MYDTVQDDIHVDWKVKTPLDLVIDRNYDWLI